MPQIIFDCEGRDIHFFHYKASHLYTGPLLMANGWPKSIIEFRKVNASLADSTKHGGASKDAFHAVCPVLPGYGFSSEPGEVWFGVETAGRVEQADAVFGLRHKFR